VTQQKKLNWAKEWCNKTDTPCKLIGSEDELDSDDFECVQQLIQERIVLTKKLALQEAEKESSSSSSSSSSDSSSRSVGSSPNSPLFRTLSEDVAHITKDMTMAEEHDDALADL
jgi:hypothetical protein